MNKSVVMDDLIASFQLVERTLAVALIGLFDKFEVMGERVEC